MANYVYFLKNSNGDTLKVGEIDLEYYLNVERTLYNMLNSSNLGSMTHLTNYWAWRGKYKANRPNGGIIRDYGMYVTCCSKIYDSLNETMDILFNARYMSPAEARSLTDSDLTEEEIAALRLSQSAQAALLGVINTGTRGENIWTKYEDAGVRETTYNVSLKAKLVTTASSGSFRRQTQTQNGMAFTGAYLPANNARQWALTHNYSADLRFSKANSPQEALTMAKTQNKYFSSYFGNSYISSQPIGIEIGVRNGQGPNSSKVFSLENNITSYEYKEVVKDSDNTYPGGGEDKNTYPDDENDPSGMGDFDNTNDPIDFPTLPTFDVQSTGFISLWKPTITQLTSLYSFLWDSDISTTLKKLFNEPMNAIFSLGIIPVDPITQGTRRLTIGHVDTEIDMESIQKQFVTFDFGSIDITEYYGAAWDYSPYTQASIYLPYIGVQPVDIDDIMNCTLTLRYNIDVLTGTTIALLKCKRKGRDNLDAVMYEWQGNCVTQCPITAGNWSQIMASVIQLGAMTGLALSQPVAGAIGNSPAMYGSTAGTKLAASASEYADGKNLVSPSMATFGALNVLGSKVHVQRGGRIDMSAGAMSMQKAFVILNRPISGIPRGWNNYAGYPSLKIKTLGSQEGFVSVGAIKLDGLRATANEIGELDAILKAGVII